MTSTPPTEGRTEGPPVMGDFSRLAKIVGNIVAPTTALTALLFYFGWAHAYWFFNYFGVESSLLGLSTTEYLLRSLDGLFVPLTVVAVSGLLLLWARHLGQAHLRPSARLRLHRILIWLAPVIGVALTLNALSRFLWETWLNTPLAVAPLSLTVGVLLLVWAVYRRRRQSVAEGHNPAHMDGWIAVLEWAAVFLLIGLSLFWAATDYSAAVGRGRARDVVAGLSTQPAVILYSERSLSMAAPGVRESKCADQEAAYRFRYDGLKLIIQSDDQYVFLPAGWNPDHGVAIVMPRNDKLRLEFAPASAPSTPPGPSC